jgi:peptide/nickel transport system substrate-binding protein
MEKSMSRASTLQRRGRSCRRVFLSTLVVVAVAGALAVSAATGAVTAKQAQIAQLNVGYVSGGLLPTIGISNPNTPSNGVFLAQLGAELAFHLTPDGVMHPWLVMSWKRIGTAGWAYQVRPGVKFWDGHELTASDVAASWNFEGFANTAGQQPGGTVRSFFKNVASIKATSKYHVLVTMKTADATWKTVPSQYFMGIFEKSFIEAHTNTLGQPGTLFVGTGPWVPSNFNPTSGVDWTANPNYWNKKTHPVPFRKIHISFYTDEQSEALAARSGAIDLALNVGNPKTFQATSGGWKSTTAPTCGVGLITMPTQTEPFNDIHVRRAIAYALNRSDIIKALGGGASAPTDYLIAPSLLQILAPKATVANALKSVPTYSYNLAKAKQEMAQSAVPSGFTTTMQESNDPNVLNVSQVIAAQLAKIGITAKVNASTTSAWFGIILGPKDKRPFMYSGTGACQPDPNWEPSLWLDNNVLDEANWDPASVHTLLAAGRTDPVPAHRLKAYVGVNKAVNTDVPYIALYLESTSYASPKYVWTDYGAYWTDEPWALFFKPRGA